MVWTLTSLPSQTLFQNIIYFLQNLPTGNFTKRQGVQVYRGHDTIPADLTANFLLQNIEGHI